MKKYFIVSVFSLAGQLAFAQAGQGAAGAGTGGAARSALPARSAGTVRNSTAVNNNNAPVTLAPRQANSVAGVTPPQNIAPANAPGILSPPTSSVPGFNGVNTSAGVSTGVAYNQLPIQVQSTIAAQSSGGTIGPITQQMTASGPVYTTSVVQNGQVSQIQVSAAGSIIPTAGPVANSGLQSQAPNTTTAQTIGINNPYGLGAQAGIPLNSLPAALQAGIASQTGTASVQAISQAQSPNGPLYTVVANQNGIPTQMQFAANGTLLSSIPIAGASSATVGTPSVATSTGNTLNTGVGTAGLLGDNGLVVWEDLPAVVQNGIRGQTGQNAIERITPRATTNGMAYNVQFQRNGIPQSVLVGPDGKVVSSSSPALASNPSNPTRLTVADLPDPVERTLKNVAPDADIQYITRQTRAEGDVYNLAFHANDRYTEMVIDSKGNILRDSRAVPVVVKLSDLNSGNQATPLSYAGLPAAIKNSVKAYTPEIEVGNVELASRNGKGVYEVEYFVEGRTDRLVFGKDGTLLSRDRNVSPTYANIDVPPIPEGVAPISRPITSEANQGIGNAAARETGTATGSSNTIALDQLPLSAQNTVKDLSKDGLIETITPRVVNSTVLYEVRFLDNGKERTVRVDKDGKTVQQ